MRNWALAVALVALSCGGTKSTFDRMGDWSEKYREEALPLRRPVASISSLEYGAKPGLQDCEDLGEAVARARKSLKGAPDPEVTTALLEALGYFDEAASLCRSIDPAVLIAAHYNLAMGRSSIGTVDRILQAKYQQNGIPGLAQ